MPMVAVGAAALAVGYGAASYAAGIAAVGVMTAGQMAAFTVLSGASSVLYGLGSSALIGAASSALMGKPATGSGALSRKTVIQASDNYWRMCYGRTMTSLNFARYLKHGNWGTFSSMAFLVACHEIDGYEDLYIGGVKIPLQINDAWGKFPATAMVPLRTDPYANKHFWADGLPRLAIEYYTGAPGQVISPYLTDRKPDKWPSTVKMTGHAVMVVHMNPHPDAFMDPPAMSQVVRGKRLYDPRSDTTVWSRNWALAVADFANSPLAGRGQITVDQASLIAAANVADEDVAKAGGGTIKRYSLDGTCTSDQAPREVLAQMLAAGAGSIGFRGDVMRIHAGQARSPVIAALTADDFHGPIECSLKRGRSRLLNSCKALYADKDDDFKPRETPRTTVSAMQIEDGGIELPQDIRLNFVSVRAQAVRLCKIELQSNRRQIRIEAVVEWRYAQLEEMDVFPITMPELGWSAKLFQVLKVDRSLMQGIGLTAIEYSADTWAWTSAEEDPPQPVVAIETGRAIELVEPLAVGMTTEAVADAAVGTVLMGRVAWTAPDDELAITDLEVRWQAIERGTFDRRGELRLHDAGGRQVGYAVAEPPQSTVVGAGPGTALIGPLRHGYKYKVDCRYRSASAAGPWLDPALEQWVVAPGNLGEPPYDVKVKQIGVSQDVRITWAYPANRGVPYFEIWMSRTGGVLATAELVEPDATGRSYRLEDLEPRNYWFWIRGRRLDGSTTPWGSPTPVFLAMQAKLGALAQIDRVRTRDIEPDATTAGVDQEFVEKNNIGAAFENLFATDAQVELPTIEGRSEFSVKAWWSFHVPGTTSGSALDIRLIRDGVTVIKEWRWNIASKPHYPRDMVAFKCPPGPHTFNLRVRAEGGPTLLQTGRLIIEARLT